LYLFGEGGAFCWWIRIFGDKSSIVIGQRTSVKLLTTIHAFLLKNKNYFEASNFNLKAAKYSKLL
jgi:hypothetical protein